MNIPADGGSAVGGNTETIEAGSQQLTSEASKLQPAAGAVTSNGRSAQQAVGDAGAAAAVASFAAAWSEYLTDLVGHVTALSRLAQVGSVDLAAAGGRTSVVPAIPGLPGSGPFLPLPTSKDNPQYPGQAPGWHPPMLPGYVPPIGSR